MSPDGVLTRLRATVVFSAINTPIVCYRKFDRRRWKKSISAKAAGTSLLRSAKSNSKTNRNIENSVTLKKSKPELLRPSALSPAATSDINANNPQETFSGSSQPLDAAKIDTIASCSKQYLSTQTENTKHSDENVLLLPVVKSNTVSEFSKLQSSKEKLIKIHRCVIN